MAYLGLLKSHGFHHQYKIPENIDVIVFSGDATNYKDVYTNQREFNDFVHWFRDVPVQHKLMIAGNHDSYIYKANTFARAELAIAGITYLENEDIVIDGVKFYGTPYTPTFGEWFFMKDRDKMFKVWEAVPEDVNILITHGPPKGILDLTINYDNSIYQCGDTSIHKFIPKWKNLKVMLMGHIHDCKACLNYGILKRDGVLYSNGSSVEDGRFDKGLVHNGNIIEI